MKINNIGASSVNPYKKQLNKIDQISKSSHQKADKVEISASAKELQGSLKIPQERQAKVEELKIQVENGSYKIEPQKIAKGLVNFHKN